MLVLISIGLYDEKDMSLRALEAARACDILYCEFYTSRINATAEKLSEIIGKPVKELKRSDLEEEGWKILEEAKTKNTGILVGGDALAATTHISLVLEARKRGIETRIIHGSSILTAAGETGLQLYNFGKATTLPFPEDGYFPETPYEAIESNLKSGLHTLVLLDTKPEKSMDVPEGIKILRELEKRKRKNIFLPETKIVAACMLGGKGVIKYGPSKNLLKDRELENKTPAVIIIPGRLHFIEKEFLETL